MNFCPKCGTKFKPEDRFCPECGYVRASDQKTPEIEPVPVEKPAAANRLAPEPGPTVWTAEPVTPQKTWKSRLWIVWIAAGVMILAAVIWFVASRSSKSGESLPATTTVIANEQDQSGADSTAKESVASEPVKTPVAEPVKTAPPAQAQAKTKPPVKTDKTASKPKVKEATPAQTEPVKEVIEPDTQPKAEPEAKNTPADSGNLVKIKALVNIGRTKTPKDKEPKNPAKLVIQKPTMIVSVTTDHYNNGEGTPAAGFFTIKDSEENIVGTYKAEGISGDGGIPNVKWVARINKVLEKGTYTITDSDMPTWSRTLAGAGFIVVEGYEIR